MSDKTHSTIAEMSSARRGDIIVLPEGLSVWWVKTSEEIDHEHEANIKAGRFLDSAGEPILISSMGHMYLSDNTSALITKTRGCTWTHWSKRPRHLTEVLVTLGGVPRYIMFSNGCKSTMKLNIKRGEQ